MTRTDLYLEIMAVLSSVQKPFSELFTFLADIYRSRRIIFDLANNDFQKRYLGSYLGIIWPFAHPTITIGLFWFVYTVGFKSKPIEDFPFVLWLLAGMIPWNFFSEALATGTNSICEYSFLVKKVVFRVSILPIVKILSALKIHAFFLLATFLVFIISGQKPSIYWLQTMYYLFATIILLLGVSLMTSSLMVFVRDVGQMIGIFIQFGFWITPVFWQIKNVPEKYLPIIKLNPVLYLVEGYRDSLVYNVWFWQKPEMTIYFWSVTIGFLILGTVIYRNTRPHFADVL